MTDWDDDYESPEEYAAAQRRAEEPPDGYFEQKAQEHHERHCAAVHGGGECDCPPYEPPRCRRLDRIPRWSPRNGWHCGTPGLCTAWGYRTPWAVWRAHRTSHEAPF